MSRPPVDYIERTRGAVRLARLSALPVGTQRGRTPVRESLETDHGVADRLIASGGVYRRDRLRFTTGMTSATASSREIRRFPRCVRPTSPTT